MPLTDLNLDELHDYRPEVFEPADFDAFWLDTLSEARSAAGEVPAVPIANKLAGIDTFDLTYPGYGGSPVRGWLHVPKGVSGPLPTVVQYLGYSGGRGFPFSHLKWVQAGYAHVVMDTRGQGWAAGGHSVTPDSAVQAGTNHAPGFMTSGITDPHTYYYRRVLTDAARLLEVARDHEAVDSERIVVTGVSQGGGIALAVAGFAGLLGIELAGVAPDVPFLCHFRRGVDISPTDPYREIARYLAGWRAHADAAFNTLGYMDGVNFGRRATAPALFSVALMDDICPPSTVFAAYHAYGTAAVTPPPKRIEVYPFNGHEGGEDHHVDAQLDWLADRLIR